MDWLILLYLGVFLKIPIIGICWLIWYAWHQETEQVVGRSDDDGGQIYAPGPRVRGPHDHNPAPQRGARRADPGHVDDAPRHVPDRVIAGE